MTAERTAGTTASQLIHKLLRQYRWQDSLDYPKGWITSITHVKSIPLIHDKLCKKTRHEKGNGGKVCDITECGQLGALSLPQNKGHQGKLILDLIFLRYKGICRARLEMSTLVFCLICKPCNPSTNTNC